MVEFFKNSIIPGIYSAIFFLFFLGVYKIFDFPRWIIKDKMKIKNEGIIFLVILLLPILLSILTNYVLKKMFNISNINNYIVDTLTTGFMWSMLINFKKYSMNFPLLHFQQHLLHVHKHHNIFQSIQNYLSMSLIQ